MQQDASPVVNADMNIFYLTPLLDSSVKPQWHVELCACGPAPNPGSAHSQLVLLVLTTPGNDLSFRATVEV